MKEQGTRKSRVIIGGALVLLLAVGGYFLLAAQKKSSQENIAKGLINEIGEGVKARVVVAELTPSQRTISVTGEARPYAAVTLYSKVSGYLQSISVDKGDNVREGQIIAVIESPELEREYEAVKADATNKRTVARRNSDLNQRGIISAQDADRFEAEADIAEAKLAGLNVQREYLRLRAPISGTVSARYADRGALVQSAANSQGGALPVISISQGNRLRVYIYLDQKDAQFVKEGDSVEITLPERPGYEVQTVISRYTGEIDAKTRMLLAEIVLDNKDRAVIPGSFVQVKLRISTPQLISVPSDAIVTRGDKHFIAVVSATNIITYKEIGLASNNGKIAILTSGIDSGETVALGIGDNLSDGSKIQPVSQSVSVVGSK